MLRKLGGKKLTWAMPDDGRSIYLTFDDGPNPDTTPVLLHILKQYDAHATFFCVGENVQKHPELFEMISMNGHSTGNHTYNHLNGWKTSTGQYLQNIRECSTLVNSRLFRPPYGRITPAQIKAASRQYSIIMWSVLSRDYDPAVDHDTCLEKTWQYTRPGAIIVFHDHPKALKKLEFVLPQFLERAVNRGYRFNALKPGNSSLRSEMGLE